MVQPTPVFLPGESHAERSLVGYTTQGHKELGTTEAIYHAHPQRLTFNILVFILLGQVL